MMDIHWTKLADKKTRYLQTIETGNTVLYTAGNAEPNLEGKVSFSNTVSVSSKDDLEIAFNFSEKSNNISISFDLQLSDSINPLCEYRISYSETGN
jgi:hypothetical protein